MALIKNPNELDPIGPFAGLIYGEPGTGKSTLSLSAPNPVMLDADNGMKRVKPRWRKPSMPMKSYQQVLDLLDTGELDAFDTIIPDTLGKFVSFIGDWCCEKDPKNRKRGGGLSQAGYGAVMEEFKACVRKFKAKGKNLLFVAHNKDEKDGDITKMRPDCPGSSGKQLIQDLDFMGYVEMHGDRRVISFVPSERFYAKNALDLDPVIEIPDPEKTGTNDFIQKFIVERSAVRAQEELEQNQKYDAIIAALDKLVEDVTNAEAAGLALADINNTPAIWDSTRVAKAKLLEKAKALNLAYDREAKKFVAAPPPKAEPEQAKPTEPQQEEKQQTEATMQPALKNFDVLIGALIEGIAACKTVAALDAYIKEQEADFIKVGSEGEQQGFEKLNTAVKARRLVLSSNGDKKAA